MDENVVSPSGGEASRETQVFQTPLARRLWALREKVQRDEGDPLEWEDIRREVRERRGEESE